MIANVPMVHMMAKEEDIEMESYGFITYDTRQTGVISSNFSGRIEKLYVKYRYQKDQQKVNASWTSIVPELLTAQENLLFLLKNDPETRCSSMHPNKIVFAGHGQPASKQCDKTGKPSGYKSFCIQQLQRSYSRKQQCWHGQQSTRSHAAVGVTTEELSVKEGMYVQKGQNIFAVYNPNRAWALLNILPGRLQW